VLIQLRPVARAMKDARPDSTWVRADGARGVTLTPLQPMLRRRYDAGDLPIYLSVQPVAHLWLSALADRTVGRPDSAARALAARARDDPRIPDWIEDALIELIAPSSRQDFYSMQLARQPGELMPLRTLFDASRPPRPAGVRGDTAGAQRMEPPAGLPAQPPVGPPDRGGRGGGGAERPRHGTGPGRAAMELGPSARFAAQSLAVAQWMAEREGTPFVGQLAVRLIAGERPPAALAGASTLPADLDRLDAEWRAWLARQNADEGFRRTGGGR
jgi:hypothetical protein